MSGNNIGSTIIPITLAVEGDLDPLDRIINKYQSATFPGLESMATKLNLASEALGNLGGKMDMKALGGSSATYDPDPTGWGRLDQASREEAARLDALYNQEVSRITALNKLKIDGVQSELSQAESKSRLMFETESERIDRLYKKRQDATKALPGGPDGLDPQRRTEMLEQNAAIANRESKNEVLRIMDEINNRSASRLTDEEKIDEWERKHIANMQSLVHLTDAQRDAGVHKVEEEAESSREYLKQEASKKKLLSLETELERAHSKVRGVAEQIEHEYQQQKAAINSLTGAERARIPDLMKELDIIKEKRLAIAAQRGELAGVGAAGKMGTRLQELGRGFEDFVVSASMGKTTADGLAMGLRGSANNAAQLAASFNPMVGAAVAIGASLATIIVPQMARWLTTSQELNKEQEKQLDGQLRMQAELAKMSTSEDPREQRKQDESAQKTAVDQRRRIGDLLAKEKPIETTFTEQLFGASNVKDSPRAVALRAEFDKLGVEIAERDDLMAQSRAENNLRIHRLELQERLKDDQQHEYEFNKWVAGQKEAERQKTIKAMDEEFKFMRDAETANIDAKIAAKSEEIDALQERASKAGNAAGSSAAMVRGSQAAESAINRAISGSRTVEDTLKSQLKVQQDMLKALNKQKQQLTKAV